MYYLWRNNLSTLRTIFRNILDFYLYSGFHIAIAAVCFILQLDIIFDLPPDYHYLLFIFASTSFLYLLHNILGLNTLLPQCVREKVSRISRMRGVLIFFLIVMGIISLYSFFNLSTSTMGLLIIFALISLWYVVPFLGNGKRLRDYPLIKIFLIALVWAAISCIIIFPQIDISIFQKALIYLERFLIVFAITVPFDIRDMEYDKAKGLKTLPLILGKLQSIKLAVLSVVAALGIVLYLYQSNVYNTRSLVALTIAYTLVIIMIIYSKDKESDYYYTGMLDSTAIIVYSTLLLTGLFV